MTNKNDNTILWIIGIVILLLVVTKLPLIPQFAIIEYAQDSENLVYQVHENIKLVDDGCIIQQRNSGVYDTYLSCDTWLYREKEKGFIDFNVYDFPGLDHILPYLLYWYVCCIRFYSFQ